MSISYHVDHNSDNICAQYPELKDCLLEPWLVQFLKSEVSVHYISTQALAESPFAKARLQALKHSDTRRINKMRSLTEIELDRDDHWRDRFMPREF